MMLSRLLHIMTTSVTEMLHPIAAAFSYAPSRTTMKPARHFFSWTLLFLIIRVKPFWAQLCYFLSLSLVGFCLLKYLDEKPKGLLDLFFMSVSSVTLATMSTVEMESFSNAQLLVITLLMLLGGEVFTSLLGLQLTEAKFSRKTSSIIDKKGNTQLNSITCTQPAAVAEVPELDPNSLEAHDNSSERHSESGSVVTRYNCIRYLSYVVMVYLLVVHVFGTLLILLNVYVVPRTRHVLRGKGISMLTFAVFTTVSSFANAGFIPTNENMVVFRRETDLLLLVIPQVLLGNTLYPTCLRLVLWVLWKVTSRPELEEMVTNPGDHVGYYDHLLQPLHCWLLLHTVFGFILVQFVLFCWMEWHSAEALAGMSSYEKIVGALFMSTNSRYGGQSIVDVSTLAPAVLVLYVIMMYLPPYTSFLPIRDDKDRPQRLRFAQVIGLSQLSYLSICIILICTTEKKKILEDPVNFSVMNIVFEVISAYGTVGYTTGYSCQRRLKRESYCKDAWYGFVGRWSSKGKVILIFVMFLGRLKKFNLSGGRAWKLR